MKIDPAQKWDLLIVDNNSNDQTRDVVQRFRSRLPINYVFEKKQGLSHARNRAIESCSGELLVFTDDDAKVGKNWLSNYVNAANTYPGAGYFGGRVLPWWEGETPKWYKPDDPGLLAGLFVHYDLGEACKEYGTLDPEPFGANFAIRRCVFQQLNTFRVDLGVKGDIPGRGEEADYIYRARALGIKGAYVGDAVCFHRVDPQRLKTSHLYRYGIQKGIAQQKIKDTPMVRVSGLKELAYGARGLLQLLKGRRDRFYQCIILMGIERGLRQQRSGS